eukprot:scaffold143_cov260-Pinguiococcus_pyrenoidosus.AAC.41
MLGRQPRHLASRGCRHCIHLLGECHEGLSRRFLPDFGLRDATGERDTTEVVLHLADPPEQNVRLLFAGLLDALELAGHSPEFVEHLALRVAQEVLGLR